VIVGNHKSAAIGQTQESYEIPGMKGTRMDSPSEKHFHLYDFELAVQGHYPELFDLPS